MSSTKTLAGLAGLAMLLVTTTASAARERLSWYGSHDEALGTKGRGAAVGFMADFKLTLDGPGATLKIVKQGELVARLVGKVASRRFQRNGTETIQLRFPRQRLV